MKNKVSGIKCNFGSKSHKEILRESYSINTGKIGIPETKRFFDYTFKSEFHCVTNPFRSYLGSGKTLGTNCLWYRSVTKSLKLKRDWVGITNIHLKNFNKEIMKRTVFKSSFPEIEDYIKELDKDIRKKILLDEAQNEFDKREFGTKAQIHKTYFLNFFRKFNTELFFNVVNLNRLEFRLEDMCSNIWFPKLMRNGKCFMFDIVTGNSFSFDSRFFYNKYDTLEYIAPNFKNTIRYIIKRLTQDNTFKELIREGSKLKVLRTYIQNEFHVSEPKSCLIYDMYVIQWKKENKLNE